MKIRVEIKYILMLLFVFYSLIFNAFGAMNTSQTLRRLLGAQNARVQTRILSNFTTSETLSFSIQLAQMRIRGEWNPYWTQQGIMNIVLRRLSEPDALGDAEVIKLYASLINDKEFNALALYYLHGKPLNQTLLSAANANARNRLTSIDSNDVERETAMIQLRNLNRSSMDASDKDYLLRLIRDPLSTPSLVSNAFESICKIDGPLPYLDEFTSFSDSAKLGFLACVIQYSALTHGSLSENPQTNQHIFDVVWSESLSSKNVAIRETCYQIVGMFVFPKLAQYDNRLGLGRREGVKAVTLPKGMLKQLRSRYDAEPDVKSRYLIQSLIDGVEELQTEDRLKS